MCIRDREHATGCPSHCAASTRASRWRTSRWCRAWSRSSRCRRARSRLGSGNPHVSAARAAGRTVRRTRAPGRRAKRQHGHMRKRPAWLRFTSLAASFAVTIAVVPRALCGRPAQPLFEGELAAQDQLARTVAREITAVPGRQVYRSGSSRFDGQSAVAIYQMAILGMGQIIREHPERRDEYLPAMRAAAAKLTDPRTLPTATRAWGHNGLTSMEPGEGHAYLGYINLALCMLRAVDLETPYAPLHDRLTAALADRLNRAPTGLIETYPGETWPPDVAAVAGSIGLHAEVTGVDRRALLERWARRFEACALHRSGYLVQRVKTGTC